MIKRIKKLSGLDNILFIALFILISTWNIPHTIALRYFCEYISLLILIRLNPPWVDLLKTNKPLMVFILYLGFQILFFSHNYSNAFKNFESEWMHFIIFSIIGVGAGYIYRKRSSDYILFFFGIASFLSLLAYAILSIVDTLKNGYIQWYFLTIYENRSEISYSALQTILLLCPLLFSKKNTNIVNIFLIMSILISIFSLLIAGSRGGTLFSIVAIIFIFFSALINKRNYRINWRAYLSLFLVALSFSLHISFLGTGANPSRWTGIVDRTLVAMKGDSIKFFCDGISSPNSPNEIMDGDGYRIMALRAGALLATSNIMGIDQSRQAFQIALLEKCKGSQKILIAHTHNGWINASLAIGAPGALLLCLVFLQYAKLGLYSIKSSSQRLPVLGLSLFSISIIWMIRGIFDATMQDQMLEFQAFIMAFLMGCLFLPKKD